MRGDDGLISTPLGFLLVPIFIVALVVILLVLSPVVWFGDQYLAWRESRRQ